MKVLPALILCLCATICLGGAISDRLSFASGFSIKPLEGCQMLLMGVPGSDNFAPNVNVKVQPYPGKMADYISFSRQQFQEMGFGIVSETKPSASVWLVEYKGSMSEQNLHWYAKAIMKNDKVYLATATALEKQWPSYKSKLKSCVDSLDLR